MELNWIVIVYFAPKRIPWTTPSLTANSHSHLGKVYLGGSTKTWNPESGIRNPETEMETETETEYGICERRFQAIDLKKNNYISNDNKIDKQIKKGRK